jgi:hypothetical protein
MTDVGAPQRMICQTCGARAWLPAGEPHQCPDCGGDFEPMGPLAAIVDRWFAPPPQKVAVYYPRHRKLIELLWTADGRGRETYEALQPPKVSYDAFLRRATDLVERGLAEGWIVAHIPAAPSENDADYQLDFLDPERWADELTALFLPAPVE